MTKQDLIDLGYSVKTSKEGYVDVSHKKCFDAHGIELILRYKEEDFPEGICLIKNNFSRIFCGQSEYKQKFIGKEDYHPVFIISKE